MQIGILPKRNKISHLSICYFLKKKVSSFFFLSKVSFGWKYYINIQRVDKFSGNEKFSNDKSNRNDRFKRIKIMQKRAKRFGGDLSDVDYIKILGISRGSYYKYI